jgi:hypothetical protein
MKVRYSLRYKCLGALIIVVLIAGRALPVEAQKVLPGRTTAEKHGPPPNVDASTASAAHVRELRDTVALLPWTYRNGKESALQSAREVCNQLLLETGFNVFLVKSLTGSMPPAMPNNGANKKQTSPFDHLLDDTRSLVGRTITGPTDAAFVLPTVDQMVGIGEALQTRYVLAGRAQWSTRSVWVGVANRAKSMCTVDLLILDMNSKRLVLDAHNVQGDSTENKNIYNTVTTVISLNPLPLILPGSVTPQEQRAVTVAAAKAIEPWLRTQRIHSALTQADLSSEYAAEATVKFSRLVSPLTHVQATLRVSEEDEKQVAALDSDEARLFALHTVNLDYTEPNKLRLQAMTPKNGQATLAVDEDTRRFAVGERGKGSVQDLSNAPTRRLSLMDFCGLLTPGMLDTVRARYVRQEKLADVQAVVYDLSYWRTDNVSYQRLWIDPDRHIVVKREVYDRNSKLKAVTLYQQPTKAAANTWLPGRVEIQNATRKRIARYTIVDAKVDEEVAPDKFIPSTTP